jgi:threonine dehydrogenase-like Zn-dependent dehydrogenase
MLASITPLGERGRGSHWGVTVTAFVVGATVCGALIGALFGGLGALVVAGTVDRPARLALLAAAALAALVLDRRRETIPGPRRQVDERWLNRFRGWVYGIGYGAQLGLGVTTVVSSAATYLALLAALLVANPAGGAIVMGCYGAVRGLSLLLAARVRSPQRLIALHSGLDRGRGFARGGGVVLLCVIVAAAITGALL